eukprot:1139480-Pelagomonas_calceolata.AAC.3
MDFRRGLRQGSQYLPRYYYLHLRLDSNAYATGSVRVYFVGTYIGLRVAMKVDMILRTSLFLLNGGSRAVSAAVCRAWSSL